MTLTLSPHTTLIAQMKQKSINRLLNYIMGIQDDVPENNGNGNGDRQYRHTISQLRLEQFEDVTDTFAESWNRILMKENRIVIYDPRIDKIIAIYDKQKTDY
ncbi:hypothetical protein M0R04_09125 [Candidatus Dojkabacteria bacterium]|jgi:hypothetical protein|nr:hypothetical protein [Candidatus Dojkabacteria bacterium]